jgi:hypothetical protein
MHIAYIDFNTFDFPDHWHETLWTWLEKMNVPEVDLLRALYTEANYSGDLRPSSAIW